MDKFIELISHAELSKVLTGTFDLSSVPVEGHKNLFLMAAHCCLNGPVGTNKVTTFPLIDTEMSICDAAGRRVSNNSWKFFCKAISVIIEQKFPDVAAKSQQYEVCSGLWPNVLSISEYRAKNS
jgi:hypothetical protein